MASTTRLRTSLPGVTVRPARRGDAAHIAVLCDIAGEGLPSALWRRLAEPGQSAFDVGRARILGGETNFNLRNSLVAEAEGQIAGLMLGYGLPDPYEMPDLAKVSEVIVPLLQLEAEVPGYWYINVLAVYPEYRRRGIGRLLMTVADELGRAAGTRGLSLIAASGNRPALSLYGSSGYTAVAKRPTVAAQDIPASGDWLLMTKPLPL